MNKLLSYSFFCYSFSTVHRVRAWYIFFKLTTSSHFTDEETEAQRGDLTGPRSQQVSGREPETGFLTAVGWPQLLGKDLRPPGGFQKSCFTCPHPHYALSAWPPGHSAGFPLSFVLVIPRDGTRKGRGARCSRCFYVPPPGSSLGN